MNVRISIIVPCYNQAEFLDDALESVQKQSFRNWECIIVNDGSADRTEVLGKQWEKTDARFKYYYQKHSGVSKARNYGIIQAKGRYILPLDADDKLGVDYIKRALSRMDQNKELKLVYCKAKIFGEVEKDWILPEFKLSSLAANNMIFCSSIFKKSDWEMVGGYDENMKEGYEDWEFWIALLKNGGEVLSIRLCWIVL